MTNIDNLASQYISNGGKYTEEEITEAMKKIKENVTNWSSCSDSVFNFGSNSSGMSEEEFFEMMQKATSSTGDLDEYFTILYDVMNTDGESGLSREEIDALFDTDDEKKISSLDIWHHLNVSSLNAIGEDADDVDDTEDVDDSEGTDDVDDEDDDAAAGDGADTSVSTSSGSVSKPENFSDMSDWDSVADYITSFLIDGNENLDQPSEIIEYLKNNGTISAEEAEFARQALIYGSQDANMQTSIKQWIENGDTFDEAIEKLGIDIEETDLYKTAKELNKVSGTNGTSSTSNDVNIETCVEQLYKSMHMLGTDEDTLTSILFDENISDEDFVQIVKLYEQKYGLEGDWGDGSQRGLVTRIEKETSFDLQVQLTSKLAERLVNAAQNGDEDAIDLLCKEIYSGTAGQNCTANDFLTTVFASTTSNELIAEIASRYSSVNSGRDLVEDIKNDYLGFLGLGGLFGTYGDEGNAILAKINEATRYNY